MVVAVDGEVSALLIIADPIKASTPVALQALHDLGLQPVHALDLSEEMLEVARQKQVYERLLIGDLTQPLDIADAQYDGIVSAGTFTTGHVGPDALDELLELTRPLP